MTEKKLPMQYYHIFKLQGGFAKKLNWGTKQGDVGQCRIDGWSALISWKYSADQQISAAHWQNLLDNQWQRDWT